MLLGLRRKLVYILVNRVYAGTNEKHWEKKRRLLNSIGHDIGEGTKIVGPVTLYGRLHTGRDVWLGTGFTIHGLGEVFIGNNCDIAPEVVCLTGGHQIGGSERRAGEGTTQNITVGDGCWVCARSTLVGGCSVGNGAVVAACACVVQDVDRNTMVGGVPAKTLKRLVE